MAEQTADRKCFATLEDAKAAFDALSAEERKSKDIFNVIDAGKKDRNVHVIERSHPLARATAGLFWGFTCAVAYAKPRQKTDPQTRAANALARLSPEERAAVLAALAPVPVAS